ncbi:MAG: LAGLIDADG family homing endonuclease, partial [Candidatus Aenigmarchaeota archaeon]|nr:LAGLIDADG family homing endonuclease [Candidatus Aenigmarchaeota archaeon]
MQLSKLNDKQRGYIKGLFEGDGYSYHDKKQRHYTVEFYLNSLRDGDIKEFLLYLLKKIDLTPHVYKDKRFNCHRIRVRSKGFAGFIEDTSTEETSAGFKIGFVSGLLDAEGYVNLNKGTIVLFNTDVE